jgi:hypothetical protein
MTARPPNAPPTSVKSLNETALSQHMMQLFRAKKAAPEPGLLLVAVLWWAKDHLPAVDQAWLEQEAEAAAAAELQDAQALYRNLAEAPGLMQATTLEEAAHAMLHLLADLNPPG